MAIVNFQLDFVLRMYILVQVNLLLSFHFFAVICCGGD